MFKEQHAMRNLLFTFVLLIVLPVLAEDRSPKIETSLTTDEFSGSYTKDYRRKKNPIYRKSETGSLRIGKRRVPVSSPIIEGLIPRKSPPGSSLGKRLLNLPVVRLFVPQPIEEPPVSGQYFYWRDSSSKPWASISSGMPAGVVSRK